MKKKLTIINQDSGYLMIDTANAYAESGYEVSLICGRLVERNTPLNPCIKLDKICRYRRSNIPVRLYSWFWGTLQILFKVWCKYRKSHLFIVSNPPLAPLIPLVCKNTFSLLIYDIYIEKPKDLPVLRRLSFLSSLWVKAHKRVLKRSEKIFTLTEGMKRNLEKYSGGKPVDIVPIWTDNSFLKPIPPESNPFIKKHQLEGKFIVLYSGNLGASSGVEYLVEVAGLVKHDNIMFVIIGEGIRKEVLKKKIRELPLNNCILLPWQKTQSLPYSLASANLAVVCLVSKGARNSIPSKLFNYMSVGSPILSIASNDSDLAEIIEQEGVGKNYEIQELDKIKDFIIEMHKDPIKCALYSKHALKASTKYTSSNAEYFVKRI